MQCTVVQRVAAGTLPLLLLLITFADGARAAAGRTDLRTTKLTLVDPGAATGGTLRARLTVSGRAKRTRTTFVLSRDRRPGRGDLALKATIRKRVTTLTVPRTTRPGAWHVIACADGTRRVRERSETNNCRSTPRPVWIVRGFSAPRAVDLDVTLDAARATTAVLGTAGGTVSATAADGTTFTLTIPDRGLAVPDTSITMTPIATVGKVPLPGTLAGGVRLEPHGLQLFGAATLEIKPAGAPPAAAPVSAALGTFDGGKDVHVEPSLPAGRTLRIPLSHFSDHVAWDTTAAGLNAANARTPGSREAWAMQNLAGALAEERRRQADGEGDRDLLQNAAYVAQFVTANERIGPLIRAAERDDSLSDIAVQEFLAWERVNQFLILADPELRARLEALATTFRAALHRLALRRAERARIRCFTERRPEAIHEMQTADRTLALLGLEGRGSLEELAACDTWELRFDSTMTQPPAAGGNGRFDYHVRGAVPMPSRIVDRAAPWEGPLDHVSLGGVVTQPGTCTKDNESYETTDESTLQGPGASGLMRVKQFVVRQFTMADAPPAISLELEPGSPTQVYVYRHDIGSPCERTQTLTQPLWALYYLRSRSLDGTIADAATASPTYRFYTGWQAGTAPAYATRTSTSSDGAYLETTTLELHFVPKPRPTSATARHTSRR